MIDEQVRLAQGKLLIVQGNAAIKRFEAAQDANRPASELAFHLSAALDSYLKALALIPKSAVGDLAITHNQLGQAYGWARDTEQSLSHYREAIRLHQGAGNYFAAAQTQYNIAVELCDAGRLNDGREYARDARDAFKRCGAGTELNVLERLIDDIDNAIAGRRQ